MPIRKTVSIDALRQVLGDIQTDELLEKMAPSKPTIRLDLQSLTLARTLFSDPLTDSKQWMDTVPVLRRYFLERGQARRGLLAWLDQATLDAVDAAPATDKTPRPQRTLPEPVPPTPRPQRTFPEAGPPTPRRAGPPTGREARRRPPAARREGRR